MKPIALKKPPKDDREKAVLLGLVELYLESGNPVGSNTLRENGFAFLSAATIRNYFVKLEETGYLKQQHSSGGRIPTSLAYKVYAKTQLEKASLSESCAKELTAELSRQTREIASYLQHCAEVVSKMTQCALFLSAPRFDQDFLLDIKLIAIDASRCLSILITDFGLVHTEILYADKQLSNHTIQRIEAYCRWRLTHLDEPSLSEEERALAKHFYNEIMLRHIVNYTHFSAEDVYKTGFSQLLNYPDFNDATSLAGGLSLFENPAHLRMILNKCCENKTLSYWIGDDLFDLTGIHSNCSLLAIPYYINHTCVGALGILGPNRIPYRQLFGILEKASLCIGDSLTRSLYKFKISFRKPHPPSLNQTSCLLLEDKT